VRLVSAKVGHTEHRLDAQIAVVDSVIADQRRVRTVYVDPVIVRAERVVALEKSSNSGGLHEHSVAIVSQRAALDAKIG